MSKFSELDEYFDPGLTLTVRGKDYTLPLPSAELGLWCRRIAQTAGEVSEASTEQELREAGERAHDRAAALPPLPGGDLSFEERMLGPAYQQMMADKLPDPYIQFCAQTAYIWIIAGEENAERYWKAGGRPEARGPANRADRRAADRMTSTGAASETKPQGYTSGTNTRQRSGRNGRGSGSRGRRS